MVIIVLVMNTKNAPLRAVFFSRECIVRNYLSECHKCNANDTPDVTGGQNHRWYTTSKITLFVYYVRAKFKLLPQSVGIIMFTHYLDLHTRLFAWEHKAQSKETNLTYHSIKIILPFYPGYPNSCVIFVKLSLLFSSSLTS